MKNFCLTMAVLFLSMAILCLYISFTAPKIEIRQIAFSDFCITVGTATILLKLDDLHNELKKHRKP